eukprot:316965-Karenia_brevis.AAC.1
MAVTLVVGSCAGNRPLFVLAACLLRMVQRCMSNRYLRNCAALSEDACAVRFVPERPVVVEIAFSIASVQPWKVCSIPTQMQWAMFFQLSPHPLYCRASRASVKLLSVYGVFQQSNLRHGCQKLFLITFCAQLRTSGLGSLKMLGTQRILCSSVASDA